MDEKWKKQKGVENVKGLLKDVRWWINLFPSVMSKKMCDEIMNHDWEFKKSMYANNEGYSKKSEERVVMDEVWVSEKMKYYDELKKSFASLMELYSKEHKDFTCIRCTNFRINKYYTDGFMSRHVDNIHHSHGQQYGYPQVSALLFLNDDYDGGEFIVSGNQYKPLKGSGIIFPSNFMFPHEVKKITQGTRWSIIAWLM